MTKYIWLIVFVTRTCCPCSSTRWGSGRGRARGRRASSRRRSAASWSSQPCRRSGSSSGRSGHPSCAGTARTWIVKVSASDISRYSSSQLTTPSCSAWGWRAGAGSSNPRGRMTCSLAPARHRTARGWTARGSSGSSTWFNIYCKWSSIVKLF